MVQELDGQQGEGDCQIRRAVVQGELFMLFCYRFSYGLANSC